MKQKDKHKYFRHYVKSKKITDNYLKSGIYGAIFD